MGIRNDADGLVACAGRQRKAMPHQGRTDSLTLVGGRHPDVLQHRLAANQLDRSDAREPIARGGNEDLVLLHVFWPDGELLTPSRQPLRRVAPRCLGGAGQLRELFSLRRLSSANVVAHPLTLLLQ